MISLGDLEIFGLGFGLSVQLFWLVFLSLGSLGSLSVVSS